MGTVETIKKFEKSFNITESKDVNRGFEGYLVKYDNIDRDGDIFVKGAFKEDIANKDTTVMLYQHITGDMNALVGMMKLVDDDTGVFVKAEFFEKDIEPQAEKIYQLVKAGALNQLSVGFGVESAKDFARNYKDGYKFFKAYIREGSVVMKSSNPTTFITEVKMATDNQPTKILDRKSVLERVQKNRKDL